MNTKCKVLLSIAFLSLIAGFSSCEKMIDVGPPRSGLNKETVFIDDLTADAAVAALYQQMTALSFMTVTMQPSLSSDDLVLEGDLALEPFYKNDLSAINPNIESTWRNSYTNIYNANAIIEGVSNSTTLTPSLKNELVGEAKFFRAFYHLYLVNLFGDIPYIVTTDYIINRSVSRNTVEQVYTRIISDLVEAREVLPNDYKHSAGERVRVNKGSAIALLSRVYLYTKDWGRAEEQASNVIANSLYSLKDDPREVFLKNNTEAIWQLIPDYPQLFTLDGGWFNKPAFNLENPRITPSLFNAFENTDRRKTYWIGIGQSGSNVWYYPVKYKETSDKPVGKEYSTVLRLAEQYLIRAEARAQQNKLIGANGAIVDLDVIRHRAGLSPTTATTQSDVLTDVYNQRRLEFFAEYGHRWFDLKRIGTATAILNSLKANWKNTDVLYPIPNNEILLNSNILQNPGY